MEVQLVKAVYLMIFFTMICFLAMGQAGAADLNKAKGTVDNIRASYALRHYHEASEAGQRDYYPESIKSIE